VEQPQGERRWKLRAQRGLAVPLCPDSAAKRASFDACSFGKPEVADMLWNRIASVRGGEENGMETMKIHVLERALTAACIVAAIAVVWWGFKILAA
jgi:hypothetical protein